MDISRPVRLSFVHWLKTQVHRRDPVGEFARYAIHKDKLFPRDHHRLHVFLFRYEGMPVQRKGVKLAHKEWRAIRCSDDVRGNIA